jgi:hypothetical protein
MITLYNNPLIGTFLHRATIPTLNIYRKALLKTTGWQRNIECCSLGRELHATTLQRNLLDNIAVED